MLLKLFKQIMSVFTEYMHTIRGVHDITFLLLDFHGIVKRNWEYNIPVLGKKIQNVLTILEFHTDLNSTFKLVISLFFQHIKPEKYR